MSYLLTELGIMSDMIQGSLALNSFEFWATWDRFARLLDVLRLHGWHRCGDRWVTPDGLEVCADEAMAWAARVEPFTLRVTMEVTTS